MLFQRSHGASEIAVVIPARDEDDRIEACLASLRPFFEAGDPVIVVDDGSRDGTAAIARRFGAQVLRRAEGRRGLAVALGYEAAAGRAAAVLILHADMVAPDDARRRILEALRSHPGAVGGALGHRIDDPRLRFRLLERGNRLRARRWQIPYGDQAQFVRTESVRAAGGFPEVPEMEDIELSLRLRPHGPWLYLDCPVLIPARHWRAGVARVTLRNWTAVLGYRLRRNRRRPLCYHPRRSGGEGG